MPLRRTIYIATLLLGVSPALHAQQNSCDHFRGHVTESDGARTTLTISDEDRCLRVVSTGRVEFTDDDADVKSLEPGASLVMNEVRGGQTRTLSLVERGGRVERDYRVNGASRAASESAEWLRGVVLDMVRGTTFGADARVARIRRQRGVPGVLDEVGHIKSDYVKRFYLEELVREGTLNDDESRRIALAAGRQIGSDHDKAEVLRVVTDARGDRRDVAAAVVAAAETIGSDHDRAVTLQRVIERAPEGEAVLVDALDAARGIGSDHDRGQVLATVIERTPLGTPATRAAFFRALDAIGSDHERSVALESLVHRDGASTETARALLASASRLGSDHEKASVLLAVAARDGWLRDPAVRSAFDATLKTVGSDAEYQRVTRVVER